MAKSNKSDLPPDLAKQLVTVGDLKQVLDGVAASMVEAMAKQIEPLQRRIAELESVRGKLAPAKLNLSKYKAGQCVAEFTQDGRHVVARSGDTYLNLRGDIDQLAARLIDFFRTAVDDC